MKVTTSALHVWLVFIGEVEGRLKQWKGRVDSLSRLLSYVWHCMSITADHKVGVDGYYIRHWTTNVCDGISLNMYCYVYTCWTLMVMHLFVLLSQSCVL